MPAFCQLMELDARSNSPVDRVLRHCTKAYLIEIHHASQHHGTKVRRNVAVIRRI